MIVEKRSYQQFCGIAKALDLVGERWTLLILRDMLLGPRRYKDLLEGLPGITTNLLAKRLKEMEANGLIKKASFSAPLSGEAYTLTEVGQEMEPVLLALGKWGSRYLTKPQKEDTVNIGWGLISLKRRYKGVSAPVTVELRIGKRVFQYRLLPDYVDVKEGTPWIADMIITGSQEAFRGLFFMNSSGKELIAEKQLSLSGDKEKWFEFRSAFGFQE